MYNNTYHNNLFYGSPARPVMFTKIEKLEHLGREIAILVADREFFKRLRFDCEYTHYFYGVICPCVEFGCIRNIYISDDDCSTLIPLRTQGSGMNVHADQIQPYAGSRTLMKLMAVYDDGNDHVNVMCPINPRHHKCDCKCDG